MTLTSPSVEALLRSAFMVGTWWAVPAAFAALLFTAIGLQLLLRFGRLGPNSDPPALVAPAASVQRALKELSEQLATLARRTPPDAIRLVEQLLSTAAALQASDIHCSPIGGGLSLTLRIDSRVHTVDQLPTEAAALVTNRLKILAKLDLHQRSRPQDGRLVMTLEGRLIEARVSTLPTEAGERLVLRLIQGSRAIPGLHALGFRPQIETELAELLARPQGLIFVVGPVGSGKSSTLYAALAHIAQTRGDTTTIVTLEDPVELRLPFATQTQINPKAQLTFATGLRSTLRQDPNVLMVGEIRDRETAEIAMQAGLTGHLLLTTVHADNAIGAFARLIDMGIEPFVLASATSASLSQRLVRQLCPLCKQPTVPPATTVERFRVLGCPLPEGEYFDATGCPNCDGEGYVGRIAIVELLKVDELLRRELSEAVPLSILRERIRARGLVTLVEDGLRRAQAAETSLRELLRVVG